MRPRDTTRPGTSNGEEEDRMHLNGYSEMGANISNININRVDYDGLQQTNNTLIKTQYNYPVFRFCVLFGAWIFADAVVALVLWLTGGDSDVLINGVKNFYLFESVFDLAVISFCKLPLYFLLLHTAESIAIKKISLPHNILLRSRGNICLSAVVGISFFIFVFNIIKGSLILDRFVNDDSYSGMPSTYYACVIWCCVTSFIAFGFSVTLPIGLRSLEKQRELKYFNEKGQEVDKDGKLKPRNASLVRLMALAKPEANLISAGMVAMLMSTGVQTIAPLYFGKVVDAALVSMAHLNRTVLTLLGIYMVGAVSSLLRAWLFTLAGQKLVARLRTKLFTSVVGQEIAFFDVNRTGELCNRLSSDTSALQNALTVNVSMLFRYTLQILGSLILMFYLNASLTGVLLAIVPAVSLGAMRYGKFVRKMRKRFQDKLADAGTQAEEALSSIRTVKSFTGEDKAVRTYGDFIEESFKVGKKLALAQGLMDGMFSLFAYGAIAAVLWYGGKLVYDNQQDPSTGITAGLLTSFLLYTLQVAMGFALLSSLYGDFMQALGASARIFTLLDRKPEIFVPANPLTLSSLSGEIEFKDVDFTYPSRPEMQVLKSVSFRVEKGQMVALVGPSGGGKSTIVSLIERFYDPIEGAIMMDGCDLKLLDVNWFRKQIAAVSQEPTLFACSIRDNIAYGRDATDDEVEEAAKQANAHEFISTFEEGYHTLVGERGIRLSGGQKQRVAIARALIMDPALLLLDEATSALDAESEHLVQEAIDRAMKGRTVIVIAHRLSTVRNANKVIVIDKGQIAEMGTHSELLARHGVYKRLVLRQLTAGQTTSPKAGSPTIGPSQWPGSPIDNKNYSASGTEQLNHRPTTHNNGDRFSYGNDIFNDDDDELLYLEAQNDEGDDDDDDENFYSDNAEDDKLLK